MAWFDPASGQRNGPSAGCTMRPSRLSLSSLGNRRSAAASVARRSHPACWRCSFLTAGSSFLPLPKKRPPAPGIWSTGAAGNIAGGCECSASYRTYGAEPCRSILTTFPSFPTIGEWPVSAGTLPLVPRAPNARCDKKKGGPEARPGFADLAEIRRQARPRFQASADPPPRSGRGRGRTHSRATPDRSSRSPPEADGNLPRAERGYRSKSRS
jgi:hypothetical protein